MSDQPDPAVAACLLQEITEIIRDSYAPLLEAKDKRIAELEEALRAIRYGQLDMNQVRSRAKEALSASEKAGQVGVERTRHPLNGYDLLRKDKT